MPRYVDPEQRKNDILDAASDALGEEGYARFTLRSLARRMGGSSTLVTHYFPTKDELIAALVDRVLTDAEAKREELKTITDPHDRLHAVIEYFLPLDEPTLKLERVRVALASHQRSEPAVEDFLARMEPGMRELFRVGLTGLVKTKEVEGLVDVIRAWTSGVVLSAVEHPEIWTRKRQLAALELFMGMLPIPEVATLYYSSEASPASDALAPHRPPQGINHERDERDLY